MSDARGDVLNQLVKTLGLELSQGIAFDVAVTVNQCCEGSPSIIENHEFAEFLLLPLVLSNSVVFEWFAPNLEHTYGVNPFVETTELAHLCWSDVFSHPLHPLRVRAVCWLKKLYRGGTRWIDWRPRVQPAVIVVRLDERGNVRTQVLLEPKRHLG